MNFHRIGFLFLLFLALTIDGFSQNSYYFPDAKSFDSKIPTPEAFLGYPVGSHYTRHDQIVSYFQELARVSDKAHLEFIGKTYEERPQVILTITSPSNYSHIDQIREEHATLVDPSKPLPGSNAPVVVLLGYSVHGAETSSGEAALLTAYYLIANQDAETQKFLDQSVVLIDPSLNPDGRDRTANWHNGYKSFPPVSDPADLEHNQDWPGGRTNHYFSNLNRDWLSAEQIESQNRLKFFHEWYPNVHIDFHEMGTNSTYYFEPSPASHQSPIVPQASYDFNATLAKYHAQALDKLGSLYFTKENFDNLSPIYGSTYPDFFGAVGVTFEQGSSRGLVQESESGLVTFPFTIRNHVTTGIATVRGAVAEKENLFKLQKSFFQTALTQAKANPDKAFIFGSSDDVNLTQRFLSNLLSHHLLVYQVPADITVDGKKFEKENAYIVPSEQPFFRIVHSIFEETPKLTDSVYYDNTSWSLIHAYGLPYAKIKNTAFRLGDQVTTLPEVKGSVEGGKASYAYLLSWTDYNASEALYYLLDNHVLVKTALKPFSAQTSNGRQDFGFGSLVIPVQTQTIGSDELYKLVQNAATLAKVHFATTSTGFSIAGIDLGSNNIRTVKKPEVALVGGQGTNFEEFGQVWFLLNQHLHQPVTKLDVSTFSRVPLTRYNTLVLVTGNYSSWDDATVKKIKDWIQAGGTLITFKTASEWAIKQGLLEDGVPAGKKADDAAGKDVQRIDYVDRVATEAAKRINGGIFLADIDTTNPIGFGLESRRIFLTKTGSTILKPGKDAYSTVAQFIAKPYISGYVSQENIDKVSNSAAIRAGKLGSGTVIAFSEDPTYRTYWHGTDRLFQNALFFGNLLQLGGRSYGAEE